MITVDNVSHKYKNKQRKQLTKALDGVSLTVNKGEIFGILGPNGAGKSTLIKILSTLLLQTSGTVTIDGKDIDRDKDQIRKKIGLVIGGERGLYWRLTGRENLYYFAELYNIKPHIYKERIQNIIELVGLEQSADNLVQNYSKGMKQRLHVARGLLIDPEIIFMDEPTIGLDVEVAVEIRKIIKELSSKGRTIIYTTHYMKEAEELCNRIAFLKKGQIKALDTPNNLKNSLRNTNIVVSTFNHLDETEIQKIGSYEGVNIIEITENYLKAEISSTIEPLPLYMEVFKSSYLTSFQMKEFNLEDVYLRILGDA